MIKEAENIILNKEYFELSAEELATVSELVQNAEEFEEMKWFLASTQQALVSDKIEASPELKQRVMDHLNKPKDERKFWLNSVTVFLFPEDKKFYQKPAFQMSLAAILIIGFLLVYDQPMDENNMALNETPEFVQPSEEDATREVISTGEEGAGGEDLFGTVHTGTDEITELDEVEEEPAMEQSIVRNNNVKSIIVTEDDVADDIPHDGYYSGPTEELDAFDDVTVTETSGGSGNANKSNNTGGLNDQPGNAVTISTSVGTSDDKSPRKDRTEVDAEGKKKQKTADTKNNRFLAQESAPVLANEDANNVSNDEDEMESTTSKPDVAGNAVMDLEKKGEVLKEQKEETIRSYEIHVNESKELKALFGTFK
ncbi:MAG: hypothetical protein R2780_01905 [Crocinitomicaceae bacterium]|nr:hypothetical protein [Crocinitomicaceae bacterium]